MVVIHQYVYIYRGWDYHPLTNSEAPASRGREWSTKVGHSKLTRCLRWPSWSHGHLGHFWDGMCVGWKACESYQLNTFTNTSKMCWFSFILNILVWYSKLEHIFEALSRPGLSLFYSFPIVAYPQNLQLRVNPNVLTSSVVLSPFSLETCEIPSYIKYHLVI